MTTLCNPILLVALAFLYFVSTSFPLVSSTSLVFPGASSIQKHISPWEDSDKLTTYEPGQNYKGLSEVKKYFHKLGYISNVSPSNLDDNFDENLVSAIQTYQKIYKLDTTGKLDHNTVRQLMMPRCGVPDIMNKYTKTSFGSDNKESVLHTVSHYSYFPRRNKWPKGTRKLTYAYGEKLKNDTDAPSVFARAFERWTNVTNIKFESTTSYKSANIKIDFYKGNHRDGFPFYGPLGETAHAFPPSDGRCHFDAAETWVVTGDVTKSSSKYAVDLESFATHEFGHLLGLGHSSSEAALMYPYINPKTRKVDLTQDDIDGIQELYRYN